MTLPLYDGGVQMDRIGRDRRSEIMRRIGRENTPPELVVRRVLHGLGLRFRLHGKGLPGKPDVVLARWKTVIFVHGCFSHGCPKCYRGHRVPKTNREFWVNKVKRNQARDLRVNAELVAMGWRVLCVWECQTHDQDDLYSGLLKLFPRTGVEHGGE